jgi:hypothetical protein
VGDGVYEAAVRLDAPATYYVFVGAPSQDLAYTDLPFLSLTGVPVPAEEAAR